MSDMFTLARRKFSKKKFFTVRLRILRLNRVKRI